jgi:hypothetical protein
MSRHPFLDAANVTLALVQEPEVAARWDEPSALAEMTVGALAEHLAVQVVSGARGLTEDAWTPRGETIELVEHYRRSVWVGADIDSDANVGIRESAAAAAAAGPGAVVERVRAAIASVDPWPTNVRPTVSMPHWEWSMATDDFLTTRMMEMVVHADDLCAGLEVETPVFPRSVSAPVFALLVAVAEDKHGQAAVTRALTRRERADSIVVF